MSLSVINTTLEEAVAKYPILQGKADVVIDNYGANHYHHPKNSFRKIWELEKSLLKPGGLLFSAVVRIGGVFHPD